MSVDLHINLTIYLSIYLQVYLEDVVEVRAAGGEYDLVGPDSPALAAESHVHQLLGTLSKRFTTYI